MKPWQRKQWCIPAPGADFVWHTEDVPDLYELSSDPLRPVICSDETPYQLTGERLMPLPMKKGKPERYDYGYERNGVVNLFMAFQPGAGWRHVYIMPHRRKEEFACVMKDLTDNQFPEADKLRVVTDNLNTHTPASLYEVFSPKEARRLASKIDIHYTPRHASWLNMAEIEISVMKQQCLDRRIPTEEMLAGETAAWENTRNRQHATVEWRFTSQKARQKLKRLYPVQEQSEGA